MSNATTSLNFDARCQGIENQKSFWVDMTFTIPDLEIVLGTSSLLFGIFGMISNLYIMYVIGSPRKPLNQTSSLFMSMAFTDFVGGVCNIFLSVIMFSEYTFKNFKVPVANYAFGMLFNIIAMLTPILMCLITTVRFIGTFFPKMYKRRATQHTLTSLQLIAWILVLIVNIYLAVVFNYKYNRPYPDAYLSGSFPELYYGYVSILVYSMVTIPIMSAAIAFKLLFLRKKSVRRRRDSSAVHLQYWDFNSKKIKATIMALVFAVFYVLFYGFTALYYTLPLLGLCQEQLGKGVRFSLLNSNYWLANGDLKWEYYFHWWLYYSAFTCSTVNCLVHFVCNSVVKKHVSMMFAQFRSKLGDIVDSISTEGLNEMNPDGPIELLSKVAESHKGNTRNATGAVE